MKLKDLKHILYSDRGTVQFAIVYDSSNHLDIESGCSVDYVVKKYSDREVKHIQALENQLLITI